MLKFKTKVDTKAIDAIENKLRKLATPLNRADFNKIGTEVVKAMKKLISRGISPIRGNGRFPRYKRQGDPKGYPATAKRKFPKKKQRPVNLLLSGHFLSKLRQFAKNSGVTIGFRKSSLAAKKEQGHREGVNTQPKRPIIPDTGSNETFSTVVQDEYLKVANAKVRKIVNKRN